MSGVIGRLGNKELQQFIASSRLKLAAENGFDLKAREAHRRLQERMRLIADVEDALRQVRSREDDKLR